MKKILVVIFLGLTFQACDQAPFEELTELPSTNLIIENGEAGTSINIGGNTSSYFSLHPCKEGCLGPDGRCCSGDEDSECDKVCNQTYFPSATLSHRGRICEKVVSCIPPPIDLKVFTIRVNTPEPDHIQAEIVNPKGKRFASLEGGSTFFDKKNKQAFLQFEVENPKVGSEELLLRVTVIPLWESSMPITMEYFLGAGIFEY